MRTVSAAELKTLLDTHSTHLLDVRTPDELATAAIEGAIAIPLHELPTRHGELPRDLPLAVICHHGVRSETAARFLEKSGFADVASVAGGIDAWSLDVDAGIPRY
jgi:rhodanese-related sulfurtransferase